MSTNVTTILNSDGEIAKQDQELYNKLLVLRQKLEEKTKNITNIITTLDMELPKEIKELNEKLRNYVLELNAPKNISSIIKKITKRIFSSNNNVGIKIDDMEEKLVTLVNTLENNIKLTIESTKEAASIISIIDNIINNLENLNTQSKKAEALVNIRKQNLLSIKHTLVIMQENSNQLIELGQWYRTILYQFIQDLKVILGITLVNHSLSTVERIAGEASKEISFAISSLSKECVRSTNESAKVILENVQEAIIPAETIKEILDISTNTRKMVNELTNNILEATNSTIKKLNSINTSAISDTNHMISEGGNL